MKKILKPLVLLIIICILIFAAYAGMLQAKFLSEGYFNKELISVEITEYESEPFKSDVKRTFVIDDSNDLYEIQLRMNEQDIIFGIKEDTSVILKFNYKDESSLISYLYKDSIGFDYGSICLKIRDIEEIFK